MWQTSSIKQEMGDVLLDLSTVEHVLFIWLSSIEAIESSDGYDVAEWARSVVHTQEAWYSCELNPCEVRNHIENAIKKLGRL